MDFDLPTESTRPVSSLPAVSPMAKLLKLGARIADDDPGLAYLYFGELSTDEADRVATMLEWTLPSNNVVEDIEMDVGEMSEVGWAALGRAWSGRSLRYLCLTSSCGFLTLPPTLLESLTMLKSLSMLRLSDIDVSLGQLQDIGGLRQLHLDWTRSMETRLWCAAPFPKLDELHVTVTNMVDWREALRSLGSETALVLATDVCTRLELKGQLPTIADFSITLLAHHDWDLIQESLDSANGLELLELPRKEDLNRLLAVLESQALSSVQLRHLGLDNEALRQLCSSISTNVHLKKLDLAYNLFKGRGAAESLCKLMTENQTLKCLILFGNEIALVDETAAEVLAQGLCVNCGLKELDIGNCALRGKDLVTVVRAVTKSNVSHLGLRRNWIDQDDLVLLLDCLKGARLQSLDLGVNPLSDGGAIVLARALHNGDLNVSELLLLCCNIADDGIMALAWSLETNTSLETVKIGDMPNTLGTRGILALAASLPRMQGLKNLGLTAEPSASDSLTTMLSGFVENTSLEVIDLYACSKVVRPVAWQDTVEFVTNRNRTMALLYSRRDNLDHRELWAHIFAKLGQQESPSALFSVLRGEGGEIGVPSHETRNA